MDASSPARGTALRLKRVVKEELVKPRYRDHDVASVIEAVLCTGLGTQLSNTLYSAAQERTPPPQPPPPTAPTTETTSTQRSPYSPLPPPEPRAERLDVVAALLRQWEVHQRGAVRQYCEETGAPPMRVRGDGVDEAPSHPVEAAAWHAARAAKRPLVHGEELLELIAELRHPNHTSESSAIRGWGLVAVELAPPTRAALQARFGELSLGERQGGLDDELRGWFAEERQAMGLRVLGNGFAPLLAQYARRGVPMSLRARVWLGALRRGERVGEREYHYYASLLREVDRVALASDAACKHDANLPLLEDPYFVFAEQVEEVLLCFTRDPQVLKNRDAAAAGPAVLAAARSGALTPFPPAGVLPLRGMSMLVYPLCYLYAQQQELYYAFRAMWCRYWCKLHTLSSRPGTLLPLLRSFEGLLAEHAPGLCLHLSQLGLHPTRVAFPWILHAFAGYLPADQTLLLWDRVVGFDSLEPLPMLAVAVFVFHAKALMMATEADHVHHVLADPSELKVVPLLQAFLFDDEFCAAAAG